MWFELFVVSSKIIHICCVIFGYIVLYYALSMSQVSLSLFIRFWLPHPLKRHRLAFGQWKLQWNGGSRWRISKTPGSDALRHLSPPITEKPWHFPHPSNVLSQVRLGLKFVCLWSGRPWAKTQQLNLAGLNQLYLSSERILAPYYCWLTPPFHNRSSFFVDS